MGISIGNRGGVKPRRRGNGLTRIRRPRGIPFHRPSGTYHRRDFMLAEAVKILFTAKGSIHNGTPTIKGVLKGATSIIFDPKGQLSRVTEPSAESQRIQGKTTIHFFQRATLSKSHRMQGVSWIVFAAKMLVHRMKGESDIVFSTSATLSGYKLRGIASFSFSAIINTMKLVKYGLLYNWYAATDARNIAAEGWNLCTDEERDTLISYVGVDQGGKLKETGLIYWTDPNVGATNEFGFNGRGSGSRSNNNGAFLELNTFCRMWTDHKLTSTALTWYLLSITTSIAKVTTNLKSGIAIRLVRPATEAEQLLPDGAACDPYIQNDGLSLPTVKIGTQVWTACNLAETKFRNGDDIPEVTNNAAWAALETAGMCAYDNDWDNVFI